MPKQFMIYEEDLCELERTLPQLAQKLMAPGTTSKTRTQLRRVQSIISNVRWEYGPSTHVETIQHDD